MFIDEASRLNADAQECDQPHVADLVRIYAMISMRVLCSPPVIETAEKMVRQVLDAYLGPNRTFLELPDVLRHDAIDALRDFSETWREELRSLDSSSR